MAAESTAPPMTGGERFDKNDFEPTWVNQDEYYMVGRDKATGRKIIVITITWIAWYDICFALTDEEYAWHETSVAELNDLARDLAADKGASVYRDRLLLNEGPH